MDFAFVWVFFCCDSLALNVLPSVFINYFVGFPCLEYPSESLIMMKEGTAFECVFFVGLGFCWEFWWFKGSLRQELV